LAQESVVDASVVLRLLLERSPRAEEVLRGEWIGAPSTIVVEVLNGLSTATRFGGLPQELAIVLFGQFRELPIDVVPVEAVAERTIEASTARGLSAYDASYVALAERLDAQLFTADKKLAAAYPSAELIA
jgi:predicted nucleic acid-binding protein